MNVTAFTQGLRLLGLGSMQGWLGGIGSNKTQACKD